MRTEKEILTNRFGLEFEVEKVFCVKDDCGNDVNQFCFDEYNCAKLIVYRDATALFPVAEEQVQIAQILTVGIQHYMKGGTHA